MTNEDEKIHQGDLEHDIRKPKGMTVGEVIKELKKFDQNAQFFVSNDEELNTVFWGFEITVLEEKVNEADKPKVVIYGLDGQVEEDYSF